MGFFNPRQALKIKGIYIYTYIISEYAWNYIKIKKNNQPTNTKQNNCEHGKNDFSPGVCVPIPILLYTTVGFGPEGHLDCFTLIGASLSTAHLANGDHLTILTDWNGAFQFRALEPSTFGMGRGSGVDSRRTFFLKLKYETPKKNKLHELLGLRGLYIYA